MTPRTPATPATPAPKLKGVGMAPAPSLLVEEALPAEEEEEEEEEVPVVEVLVAVVVSVPLAEVVETRPVEVGWPLVPVRVVRLSLSLELASDAMEEALLWASEATEEPQLSALEAAAPAAEVMDEAAPGTPVSAAEAMEVAALAMSEAMLWPPFTAVWAIPSAWETRLSIWGAARAEVATSRVVRRVNCILKELCIECRWFFEECGGRSMEVIDI